MLQVTNDFQARYAAAVLSKRHGMGKLEKLIPVFLRSGLEVYPHQIEAAAQALHNPYSKGYILADEVGLGKAVEAGLIIAQSYYDGSDNIIVIVPKQQTEQWQKLLVDRFGLTVKSIGEADGEDEQKAVRLATYEDAVAQADKLKETEWDLVIIDEAHRLRKFRQAEAKTAEVLFDTFKDRKKILLTATPIIGNVMDLWGLVTFIDEYAFGDADDFYKRYYKKPDNYPELKELLQPYIFRTLRGQVKADVLLPDRLIHTEQYTLSPFEKEIYSDLEKYLAKPKKVAFPEMDSYELNLMMFKLFSSSLDAFEKTLAGVLARLNKIDTDEAKAEAQEIKAILGKLSRLMVTTKGGAFLRVLHQTMQGLKAKGLPQKAVVFTENTETQKYILGMSMLGNTQYNAIEFKGAESIEEFKKKNIHVLVATDVASEGFNLEFCNAVFNFDLPWGLQKVEQRIGRVHRIGQKNDVLVFNFLNSENFADVRIFELAYRRTATTADILGASDNFISIGDSGNKAVADMVATGRNAAEVEADFEGLQEQLADFVDGNKREAVETLFNTFDERVAEKTKHYAEYIKAKVAETKALLWDFCRYAIRPYGGVNEAEQSIYLTRSLFKSGNIYNRTMYLNDDGERDRGSLITLSNKNIQRLITENFTGFYIHYLQGHFTAEIEGRQGEGGLIGFYGVTFRDDKTWSGITQEIFVGQASNGRILSDEECRQIIFGAVDARTDSRKLLHEYSREREATDGLLEEVLPSYIADAAEQLSAGVAAEIRQIKRRTAAALLRLESEIQAVESEIAKKKAGTERTESAFAINQHSHEAANRLNLLRQTEFIKKAELKKREADEIAALNLKSKIRTSTSCLFVVQYTIRGMS